MMGKFTWHQMRLIDRVRWLRYILPPLLVVVVVFYQLGIAQALENNYGHTVHYGVEVAFYSLTGPVVTWLMLVWVERKLAGQERLEQQIQAAEQEKASVVQEERARIARDLHDGMAQTLYFLALKTDMLRQKLATDAETVQELQDMGKSLRQIIRDVRRTIFALRALDWSREGFLPVLVRFVEGFSEQMGWQTSISLDEQIDIPARLEPSIFRLVQESLNNAAKHAQATQVKVILKKDNSNLWLIVQDNGSGFTEPVNHGGGLGLDQMAGRVTAVGGTFHVESRPGMGTSIIGQIPLTGTANG
jgi:signal transduction histidine kinase